MEGWQRAFILHNRPWNETSLVLDVFTEEPGHVRLVAKDARPKHSNLRDTLQPLTPLLLHFGGRGEVKTLRSAEIVSLTLPLGGVTLCSGLYINELISRVLKYETCFSTLFFDCLNCIQAPTGTTGSPGPASRRFELALLGHLEYGVDFIHCVGNGELANDTMTYRYQEEKGFIANVAVDNVTFAGRHLEALESREFPGADTLHAAKRFTRMVLEPCLGGKPLKGRELFRQFMPERK